MDTKQPDGPAAEWVAISAIKPWARNPRRNEKAIKKVAESIQRWGFGNPIIARREDGEIIAGHTRLEAAKKLGLTRVPVRYMDLSAAEAHLLAVADNRLGEIAEWDDEELHKILSEYSFADTALAGWNEKELEELARSVGEDDDQITEDEPPSLPVQARTQPGDIWQLGEHRVICGDACKRETYEALMGHERADIIVTDPPYNVAYVGKTPDAKTIQNDSMDDAKFREFLRSAFEPAFAFTKPGSAYYIWHADSEGYNFRGAVRDCAQRVRQCLIWNKTVMVMGRQDYHWQHEPCLYGWIEGAAHRWFSDRKQTTVLNFDRPSRSEEHPTMKPVGLFAYLMRNSSRQSDLVLDPFLGSGTSVIAAHQTGRRCYGIELDPRYCDVIVERWEKLTGESAQRATLAA